MVRAPRHAHSLVPRAIFFAKSRGLIARRALLGRWTAPSHRMRRQAVDEAQAVVIAGDVSPLYTVSDPRERELELGKIHNLRTAGVVLDRLVIPAGQTFSFWRQVGRPVKARGYVVGRELRAGCLIPTVGGGICQLSNALHRVALTAGCRIDERHRHSAVVNGLAFDPGTDATVYWNYVDLRFTVPRAMLLRVKVSASDLHVHLSAAV
jgi:hypothetical protein